MNSLLLALLLAQPANPYGTGTCPAGECVYQITRTSPVACRPCSGGGGGGGTPAGSVGNLQTNAGGGAFGAYAGSSCAGGQFASSTNASGAWTCAAPASTPPGGSAGQLQTNNGAGGFGGFAGTSCSAGDFVSALNGTGNATCATPAQIQSPFQPTGTGPFDFYGRAGQPSWRFSAGNNNVLDLVMSWCQYQGTTCLTKLKADGNLRLVDDGSNLVNIQGTQDASPASISSTGFLSGSQGLFGGSSALNSGYLKVISSGSAALPTCQFTTAYQTRWVRDTSGLMRACTCASNVAEDGGYSWYNVAGQEGTSTTCPIYTPSVSLNQVTNPSANKTFNMANRNLVFSFTSPAGGDGAFELEAIGAFTGDLLHVHQHTGNPGAGTDLVHLEATDADVTALRINHSSASNAAIVATGTVAITGATSITGNLTQNGGTTSLASLALGTVLPQTSGGTGTGALTCAANERLTSNGTVRSCSALPTIPTDISGEGFWVKTASANLSNEVAMGALGTGLVINTTTTGVPTIYAGATCTNRFLSALNASGAGTCTTSTLAGAQHANQGTTTTLLHGNAAGNPSWAAVDLANDTAATVLPMTKGGTGSNISGTTGALHYSGSSTTTSQLADVATGSALVSGGTNTVPAWSATGTCTSSSSTTCTITGRRSGCLPVCSMTTAVSTTFRAAISSTTITCTFGTSGTNTCNCICF